MSEKIPQGDLTKLMLFFGRIPEPYIQKLKEFPFIFFNDIDQFILDHDIRTNKEERSLITYNLTLKKDNDSLDKRYEALLSAVRSLFWKEMQLKILIDGKEVYKSE